MGLQDTARRRVDRSSATFDSPLLRSRAFYFMTAIDDLFANLKASGKKALMPFITAGDPSVQFTSTVLQRLDALGCSLAEVGIPYSDPIADGPVIQASYTRALNHKVKLEQIFEMVARDRAKWSMPLVSMVSYAIIHRQGPAKYVDAAKAAGFAGAIVPDLLVEESVEFSQICKDRDFNLIQLVTPTTPPERALKIAEQSSGFLYFVSVTGITGERTELPPGLVDRVGWLRERTRLPICIGFGISKPEHVRLLSPVCDGLIVGSAIVRCLEKASVSETEALDAASQLVQELLAALNPEIGS
jgi:tryptophan synthase alpha chain